MQNVLSIATTILLALGGGGAIVLSLSSYLGKIWAQRLMNRETAAHGRELERLRSELAARTAQDVEHLKASLQLAAVEHEIRFSKLHEKRAKVLANLYRLLVAAYWQVSEFTSPMQVGDPDRKKQYAAAINAVAAYFRFFDQHRIWLPPDLCDPLEAFARQLRTPTIHLGVYLQIERPTEKTLAEQSEAWDKAWQAVDGDVPKLRVAIEAEFRKLLGAGV